MAFKHYTEEAREIGAEIKEHFGEMSARQIWLIVRLAKLARRSCRHNTAFNSAFAAAFPHATFRQVPKVSASGRPYQGLQVEVKEETVSNGGEEE